MNPSSCKPKQDSKTMTLQLHHDSRFFNHYVPAFYFLNQKEREDKDCRIWLD